MSYVTFATCGAEGCHARSEEYGSLPSCRDCGAHCCPAHVEPGTLDAETDRCQCKECATGNCPSCGKGDLEMKAGTGRDSDTGSYDEDFLKCNACGDCFDLEDVTCTTNS